ncbi:Fe-S protein assembly co-chaperone HscB [Spongiibacter sp.]|uniref:Fe-S protein assembly co-chaperone HscB n=1 Tax=Spongiibacter sp. TaxID=2024860 RepID=UPI003561744B
MADNNRQQDHFSLLGVERSFELDERALTLSYRALQRSAHPDRFAGDDERQRRLAVQKSAQINEAYETLRSPTRRAAYLLELAGQAVDGAAKTFRDPEFLMQQMQLREELAELHDAADPEQALDAFYRDVDSALAGQRRAFQQSFDAGDFDAAKDGYAKLQFLEKLRYEAEQKEGELLDF